MKNERSVQDIEMFKLDDIQQVDSKMVRLTFRFFFKDSRDFQDATLNISADAAWQWSRPISKENKKAEVR